jgi:hypothetical protein
MTLGDRRELWCDGDMRFRRPLAVTFSLTLGFAIACGGSDPVTTPDAGGTDAGQDASTCSAPKTTCGSACVDLQTDPTSCGVCGTTCGSAESCCAGSCSTSCSFVVTAASPDRGPMSGGTWLTIAGKGFAPGAKVFVGKARAPARVIDATKIVALTPPGLDGAVDVRVVQGSSSSSRAGAFRYVAYGFKGPWKKIDMSSARGNWPGVSVMPDGRVLVTGGVSNSNGTSVLDTADIYDPSTTTSTATSGKMSAPRWTQAQVTLLDGQTLVLGTWFGGYSPPSGPQADRFDGKGNFTPTTGKPSVEHRWPHAVLLADGRVLVASFQLAAPEIYNPSTDAFTVVKNAPDTTGYTPVRMLDGRVLFVKGAKAPVRIYDPDADAWSVAGDGPTATDGQAYTLPDGRILYVAGTIATSVDTSPTDVLELFDPKSTGFSPAAYKLKEPRQKTLTTAMLGDGSVLVIGGEIGKNVANPACSVNGFVLTSGVERVDPIAGTVTAFDPLPEKNFVMSGTTLLDGSVVAAGGAPCGGAQAFPYFYFLQGTPPPN